MQISSNNNAAFNPVPAPAPSAEGPPAPAPAAQPSPQGNAGAQLRALAQTPVAAQAAQYDASVATGSDTVGQEPRQLTRQNDSNGRGSQGGADSQSQQGQTPADSLRTAQASGAVLGPSGGGRASVGPGSGSGHAPSSGRAVLGPSRPPVDPGPFHVSRIPGPGDIGYKPSAPSTPKPAPSPAVIGPSRPPVDPGPFHVSRIPGPGDIGYKPTAPSAPKPAVLDASAPPGAVAKFDGEWLDKDGNMITQPGRIGIIRHPQPGEENYALFKQLTDPHGTRDGGSGRGTTPAPVPSNPARTGGAVIGPSKPQLDASAPPGAVAKFDGEWLDKDGNMITQPGRIGIIRHPQPGEENYALFKQLTDPHGTRDKPTQAPVPMPKQPGNFEGVLKPVQAPDAQAVAPVQGAQAVAPVQGAGSASKAEVQGLELMLADPDTQAMVAEFGGPLKPVPQGTKVAEGIVARYGEDLGARLYQYQNAVRGVENAYAKSLDEALKNPGPNVPGSYAVKGDPGNGVPDGWQVDPVAFTRAYAAGTSTAQRAFANIHGADPLKLVKQGNEETGNPDKLMLNGRELKLGSPNVTDGGNVDGWIAGKVERHYAQLDPARITKLHNPEMLWFDPQQGFVTHPDNIKDSLESKIVLTAVMAAATFGVGVATAGLGTLASSTITAGLSSAMGQGLATGEINGKAVFKSMLTSVVTGALGNSANSLGGGLAEMAQSRDAWDRLGAGLIQAGGKGLASQLSGGSFAGGAMGSLLNSAGAEVTRLLGVQIDNMVEAKELDSTQASALRMTSKAVGAAITQLRNGGNSAMKAMAQEYLQGVRDELGLKLPAGLLKP